MFDPLGKILTEIRGDAGVAAMTDRIRGGEPGPEDARPGTPSDPYRRFVVLVRLDPERAPRVPLQTVLLGANCYGTSYQDAAALAGAVSDAIHHIGPRLTSAGFVIYASHQGGGGGSTKDPATGQPFESLTIEVVASTMAAGVE